MGKRKENEMGGISLLEGREPGASFWLTVLGRDGDNPKSYRMHLLGVGSLKQGGETVIVALGEQGGDAREPVLFAAVVRQDGIPVSATLTLIRDGTASPLERVIVGAGGKGGEDIA